VGLFLVLHLVVSPLVFTGEALVMKLFGERVDHLFAGIGRDGELEGRTVVLVSTLSCMTDIMWLQGLRYRGQAMPAHVVNVGGACSPATLTRRDERRLVVRPRRGYLLPRGQAPGPGRPALGFGYFARYMDHLFRSPLRPMRRGERVELTAATVEVADLTEDGRPAEAVFRFAVPLDDPSLRWLQLTEKGYVAFTPPEVGETVEVSCPLD
jgi:hypothetical protein